jgi:hypothetical protein
MDTKLHIYNFAKLYQKLNNTNPIIQDTICYVLSISTLEIIIYCRKVYEIESEAPIIYYDDINETITFQITSEIALYTPILVKIHNMNVFYTLLYDKKYYFDLYKNNNSFRYVKYVNYLFSNIFPDFINTEEYFPIKYKYNIYNCDYLSVLIICNFLKNGSISKENRRKLYKTLTKKLKYSNLK